MMKTPNQREIVMLLWEHGGDILCSEGMEREKEFIQHGTVSVYHHCVCVAYMSVWLSRRWGIQVSERALIRGALLHDYFLYDWHIPDPSHRLHGFTHPKTALENASRDFDLGYIERDIIRKHMFPLNLAPPKYRESAIVCMADKICATAETFSVPMGMPDLA